MKIKNIPEIDKSKSIKEVRVKINSILEKLEKKDIDLEQSTLDYQTLIQLNKKIEQLFREKSKNISNLKKDKIND